MASSSAEVEVLVRNMRFASAVYGPMLRLKVLACALLVAYAAGGCSMLLPNGGTTPPNALPLLTIEARGGHCLEGECKVITAISRERILSIDGPGEAAVAEEIDPTLYATLEAAVQATDYATIVAVRFTGECPTAFDGQELIYTFYPIGRERAQFSSCEVEIPVEHPLFRALDAVRLQSAP